MTGSDVISNAAVATLSIPANLAQTDPLLCIVASLAHPQQLEIEVAKPPAPAKKGKGKKGGGGGGGKGKGVNVNVVKVELLVRQKTLVLSQRNAILRALCGLELHNILDGAPYYLLAGCSASGSTLPSSAATLASISSWMSVASTLRDGSDNNDNDNNDSLLRQLDGSVLHAQSFLVRGCGRATLADLDVYFALRETMTDERTDALLAGARNARRWWNAVQSTVADLVHTALQQKIAADPKYVKELVSVSNTVGHSKSPRPPIFYYGEEGEIIPDAPVVQANKTTPSAGKGDKGKSDHNNKKNAPLKPTPAGSDNNSNLTDEQKKAAADKRAKKKAEKAAKSKKNAAPANNSSSAVELDISALDIRVGRILKVWEHESAEKLYCEEVDVGEPEPRKIASGLRPFYKLEDLQNRSVLVLCNLKARSLVGFPSHGMVLCASNKDHTRVEFVSAPTTANIGERVLFEGYEKGEPEAENKVNKKKIFEKMAPDLKTDQDGGVVWKGKKAMAGGGQCKAVNNMPNGSVA